MIVDIPDTTSQALARTLVKVRDDGGAVALGRVLTLIILPSHDDCLEDSIVAANAASREHPCRIIVVAPPRPAEKGRLDGEVRVGGDAGASEVVILRPFGDAATSDTDTLVVPLMLSDAPVVVWWPSEIPDEPAKDPIGRLAHARITDALNTADPRATLARLRENRDPNGTDLCWTRDTVWRGLLAATLDQPPFEPVTHAVVTGDANHPSVDLVAGWLAQYLRCPVELNQVPGAQAITRVVLTRASGDIVIDRQVGAVATFSQPDQPVHRISLPVRTTEECLAEELRRLDPDEIFTEVLMSGLGRLDQWRDAPEAAK